MYSYGCNPKFHIKRFSAKENHYKENTRRAVTLALARVAFHWFHLLQFGLLAIYGHLHAI